MDFKQLSRTLTQPYRVCYQDTTGRERHEDFYTLGEAKAFTREPFVKNHHIKITANSFVEGNDTVN